MLPYTTGLDKPQETALSQGVVARLAELGRDRGYFLAAVGEVPVMPSRLDDEGFDQFLHEMRGRAPCAFVAIESAESAPGGSSLHRDQWERTYTVGVAVFTSHSRDFVAGRMNPDIVSQGSDQADPGIRAICELCDVLLCGWPLGIASIEHMRPRSMRTVFSAPDGILRELRYEVRAQVRREPYPDIQTYLESILTTLQDPGLGAGISEETDVL